MAKVIRIDKLKAKQVTHSECGAVIEYFPNEVTYKNFPDYGGGNDRYGHLMSFRVKGGGQAARDVFDGLERIWRATDLGRIKSVATIPSISTHSQQGEEGRKISDIPPNLIRLNVGAEHPDDVIDDLNNALAVLDGKKITYTSPEYSVGGASSATLRR